MSEHGKFLDDFTGQVFTEFNRRKEALIKFKLKEVKLLAEARGDRKLLTLLYYLENEDLEAVQVEMERNGYRMEIQMPSQVMTHGNETINFDLSGMKLIVYQIVAEV